MSMTLKKISLAATLLIPLTSFANLTYSNTDFNQAQPGWSDTLTVYNNSSQPVTITQLQFETNYDGLDTTQLYGSVLHSANKKVIPEPIAGKAFDYLYVLPTVSDQGTATVIPANGSVNLTSIPLAHEQSSVKGIPLYYRLPFNLNAVVQGAGVVSVALQNACAGNACQDPAPKKIVGAYFTNWANYHYGTGSANTLMPNQIPLRNLNTVYYDVGKIDPATANIYVTDINHDQYYLPAFDTLKQQYPYLNLIYSFGGWGDAGSNSYPSYDLATIFDQQNSALIQTLANNMVNTMLEFGFSGIDIDYEWNAIQPGTAEQMKLTPARAQGYQELLQDIRADLNKLPTASNYKLTTAVFANPAEVENFVNNKGSWTAVAAAVSYIDIMAYDFHGQFDVGQPAPANVTAFQSGMLTDHHFTDPLLPYFDVTDAVAAYQKQNVPAAQLIVGIPAYTRIEKYQDATHAATPTNQGLYLTLTSDQPNGESNSGGLTDYKCVVDNNYCWNNFSFNRNSLVMVPANFSGSGVGASGQTPWAYDASLQWFMSFDDGASAKNKAVWVKNNNLGGVMIWEIDGDIPLADAHYQENSVVYNSWLGFQ